jgi:hypothetical protein
MQADAALAQQDKIGGQTDRGEEQLQEGGLCRCVEGDREPEYSVRDKRQYREEQTAEDRRQDAVAAEERRSLSQEATSAAAALPMRVMVRR